MNDGDLHFYEDRQYYTATRWYEWLEAFSKVDDTWFREGRGVMEQKKQMRHE